MNNPGIYIYGIINSATRELNGNGRNGNIPVYLIPYQNVAAVVSDAEVVDLSHLRKDALAQRLVDHQRVIEGVMGLKHTIIPMKLGTFAGNPSEVQEILARSYKTVAEVFHTVCDKLELDVVVTWPDLASVLKAIGEEPEIREAKQKLLANPRLISIEDQMRVGLMVKKALDARRERLDSRIRGELAAVSRACRSHELVNDQMITSAAFLVDRERQAEFDECLERLNVETGETLRFRCIGPLPPYSFCTLEVRHLHFEDVDWARVRLGLPSRAAKDEIKKAYQVQAVLVHPDKHPDAPGMGMAFDEVNRAYKTLVEYETALDQAGVSEGCSFREQDVRQNGLLVKIRE